MDVLKRHWLALGAAIVVGFIVAAPNILFTHSASYAGLPLIYTDAETYYLARLNASLQGCNFNCNPFFREYASGYPFFEPSLLIPLLAAPGMLVSLSALELKLAYDFLLPALFTLLVYGLLFRLTKSTYWSLTGSFFLLLGFNLVNSETLLNLSDIFDLARFQLTSHTRFLFYARPIHPQASAFVLFAYFHVLLSCFRSLQWYSFALLALFHGLSFYVYFYDYTFITLLAGISVATSVVLQEYRRALLLALSSFVGVLIGIPLLLNINKMLAHPLFASMHGTDGTIVHTYMPHISVLGILLCISFLVSSFLYIQHVDLIPKEALFVGILALASFVILNQHILTGFILENFHYEWFVITPIVIIFLTYALHVLIPNEKLYAYRFACAALLILPILNGVSIQYASYNAWIARAEADQKYIPTLNWLRGIEKESVVAASPELSALIAISTHHKILWAPYAFHYMHDPEREIDARNALTSCGNLGIAEQKYHIKYVLWDTPHALNCKGWEIAFTHGTHVIYTVNSI